MRKASKVSVPKELSEKFIITLLADVGASLRRHDAAPSQQNSRDLIRTLFAAIEGAIWSCRDHVVGIAEELERLDVAQAAALQEVSYQVSKTGAVSSQPRYVPIGSMFRLVARISKALDPDLKIDFGTGNWERFLQAIAIRNRITHPKTTADLELNSADLDTSLEAFHWLLGASIQAMQSANNAFRTHVHQFSEILDALKAGDPEMVALYEAAKAAEGN